MSGKITLWRRYGPEKAEKIFGADEAFPINQLSDLLPKYLKGTKTIYLNPGDKELKEKIISFLEESNIDPMPGFKDPTSFIHEMRLFKDRGRYIDHRNRSCGSFSKSS